jgi:hypothetical protein
LPVPHAFGSLLEQANKLVLSLSLPEAVQLIFQSVCRWRIPYTLKGDQQRYAFPA